MLTFTGCRLSHVPSITEETPWQVGTIFLVEQEPTNIPSLPGVQQVVLRAKAESAGQIVALVIPPRHLTIGSEVEVRRMILRDSLGSRTGEFPVVKNVENEK